MSEGMNRVFLLGNLTAQAELRATQGGQTVLKFRVACSERYKGRDNAWQERTEYVNVVVWGKRAEGLGKVLSKGDRVLVEGSLRTTSYDDRDGKKRYKTEVIAKDVFLNPRGQHPQARSESPSEGSPGRAGGYSDEDYGGDDGDLPF